MTPLAHPKTKAELLSRNEQERRALSDLLGGLTAEQMLWPCSNGWSASDIVAHLSEWERLLEGWYDAGLRGETVEVPAPGYTWSTLHDLNTAIYARHRGESAAQAMSDWHASSYRLDRIADWTSEEDLFAPGRFAWTGRGTLASFIWECGGNHYRWAADELRSGLGIGQAPRR